MHIVAQVVASVRRPGPAGLDLIVASHCSDEMRDDTAAHRSPSSASPFAIAIAVAVAIPIIGNIHKQPSLGRCLPLVVGNCNANLGAVKNISWVNRPFFLSF